MSPPRNAPRKRAASAQRPPISSSKTGGSARSRRADPKAPARGPGAPTGIGAILEELKQTTALGRHIEHAIIWERWPDIAGPGLYAHGRPVTIRDNRLHIEAESAVWVHKFTYRRWDIVKRINALAGKEIISDVFTVLEGDPGDADSPSG